MSKIKLNIDGELNLNNVLGYDIAILIKLGRFDEALEIARFALHGFIEERFEQFEFYKEAEKFAKYYENVPIQKETRESLVEYFKLHEGQIQVAVQNGFIKPSDLI